MYRFQANPDVGRVAVYADEEQDLFNRLAPMSVKPKDPGHIYVYGITDELLAELWWLGLDYRNLAGFYQWKAPLVEGKYQPFSQQRDAAAFLTLHNRAYNTSTMRTGKTAATVMALEYLRTHGYPGKALIICPLTIMKNVWGDTLTGMVRSQVALLRGSRDERRAALADGCPDYLIINYDGLDIMKPELTELIKSGQLTKVVIDELTAYSNTRTHRWKVANAMLNGNPQVPVVWGLTGTPATDSEGVYGMAKLVNPSQVNYRTLSGWRAAVHVKWGSEPWQFRDRPEAPQIIHETMQPTIRFVKEMVLPDLPEVEIEDISVSLTEEQVKAYQDIKVMGRAMMNNKEVTANQKAILLQKLFQISLGHVRATDGQVARLDASPRLEVIERIIGSTSRKTVIFGAYINVNDALVKHLKAKGLSVAKVDGSVTGKTRDDIFSKFQKSNDPRVLVVHPRTTAYGTELARADKLIFNGPMMSGLHIYLQAIERLSSLKQEASTIKIYCIFGLKEEQIFQAKMNHSASWANCVADSFNVLVS
jgi:hypothetical protein